MLAVARDTPRSGTLTPLRGLLDDAESRWRGPLAEQGRPLNVRLDDPALVAQVSTSVLREIVDVLLDNAVRHGAGAVNVHARRAGGSVAVDVADEGEGLALDADELFARRHGSAGGHGIGLALARSLAHAEGGRMLLTRPAPPVFTLFLPGADDGAR